MFEGGASQFKNTVFKFLFFKILLSFFLHVQISRNHYRYFYSIIFSQVRCCYELYIFHEESVYLAKWTQGRTKRKQEERKRVSVVQEFLINSI